jgi:uncharacterized protein YwgA
MILWQCKSGHDLSGFALSFVRFCDDDYSKTMLQKRIYFLGVGLGKESALGYRAHYYGPYSAAVAEANSELKSLGYLSECSTSWGSDQRGFEIARYDYSLTREGWCLYNRKKNEYPDLCPEILRLAEAIKSAGDLNYWELSIAAKTYFILKNHGMTATFEEIQKKAQGLGWEVTERELEKATVFLEKMDLVQSAAA